MLCMRSSVYYIEARGLIERQRQVAVMIDSPQKTEEESVVDASQRMWRYVTCVRCWNWRKELQQCFKLRKRIREFEDPDATQTDRVYRFTCVVGPSWRIAPHYDEMVLTQVQKTLTCESKYGTLSSSYVQYMCPISTTVTYLSTQKGRHRASLHTSAFPGPPKGSPKYNSLPHNHRRHTYATRKRQTRIYPRSRRALLIKI